MGLGLNAMPIHADQRRDDRHMTMLIVGKVRGAAGEFACVVNDVSCGGLRARFPHPPQLGERLVFALRGLPEMTATVRWVRGCQGGVEFDCPVALDAVLDRYGAGRRPRAPRFTCDRPTEFILGKRESAIEVVDVSLGGAKLRLDRPAGDLVGRAATLVLPMLHLPRAGTVRWVTAERAGFQFAAPLPLGMLADLLSRGAG